MPTLKSLASVLIASLALACTARNGASLANDTSGAEDVNGSESDLESLGSTFVGSDGQSLATSSPGCLHVSVDNASQKATYVFNGCTGPLGLAGLTGTVAVTWQVANGRLTVDYAAAGFKINRATIDDWQATAVVTATGDAREMVWKAQLMGTTRRGRPFQRTNEKDVKWIVGQPCISATGQSSGTVLRARLQTTVVSFRRCADQCPQAGSEIQVQDLDNGGSIDIQYHGGPEATLTVDGRAASIGLACGD